MMKTLYGKMIIRRMIWRQRRKIRRILKGKSFDEGSLSLGIVDYMEDYNTRKNGG